jgi:hypothetical protein
MVTVGSSLVLWRPDDYGEGHLVLVVDIAQVLGGGVVNELSLWKKRVCTSFILPLTSRSATTAKLHVPGHGHLPPVHRCQ